MTSDSPQRKTSPGKNARKLHAPKNYRLILFLQFAASVALLYLIFHYLPFPYLIGAGVIFSLLIVICSLLIFSKTSKISRGFGKVLSLLLSFCLIGSSVFVYKSNLVLEHVTGTEKETISISVVVMKNNSAQSLGDIRNGIFGYNTSYDEKIIDTACEEIRKDIGKTPETDTYTQFRYLADGLYQGEADAIIFNEAYRTLIESSHKDFDEQTRVLKTFSVVAPEKLAASAVSDVTKDCFIAYISGIDARGEVTAKSRTDANMLVAVNPVTHQVLLLGIPRDYYVPFHSTHEKDKLTHTGMYGINESIDTLEDLLGIQINYYARLNFSATVDIIDALGGVNVSSPVAFTTLDGKYKIEKGVNHMNGDMALYFMRSRKMLAGGDNDRVSNQIRVIRALLNELMSFKTVTNYNRILTAAQSSVQTNMTSKEIQKLIQMQIQDMPEWDIQNYQLSGSDLYTYEAAMTKGVKSYVMEPDPESVQNGTNLLKQMQNNETISLEKME